MCGEEKDKKRHDLRKTLGGWGGEVLEGERKKNGFYYFLLLYSLTFFLCFSISLLLCSFIHSQ